MSDKYILVRLHVLLNLDIVIGNDFNEMHLSVIGGICSEVLLVTILFRYM